MKFNSNECKVIRVGQNENRPQHDCPLVGNKLQTSLCEKDLGVSDCHLTGNKLQASVCKRLEATFFLTCHQDPTMGE